MKEQNPFRVGFAILFFSALFLFGCTDRDQYSLDGGDQLELEDRSQKEAVIDSDRKCCCQYDGAISCLPNVSRAACESAGGVCGG